MILKVFGLLVLLAPPAFALPVTVGDVPAYNWYHGCGPTAAASVLGYWDLHGYGNLFTASGSDVFLTSKVQDQISSPEHNAKYDPNPDDPNLPVPAYTSIADYFRTSVGYNVPMGWSLLAWAPVAFEGYSEYRGYEFKAATKDYTGNGNSLWIHFVKEIDDGRPSMFLVDSNGDGTTDHFVPVLGYDDRGEDGLWYGYYDTLSEGETLQWSRFQRAARGCSWGVYASTFLDPVSAPAPAPSTLLLMGSGLAGLAAAGRRRMKK